MTDSDNPTNTRPTDAQPARDRNPVGRLKIIGAGIVALALLVWIGQWFYYRQNHVSGDDASVAASEITVSSRLSGRLTQFPHIGGDLLAQDAVIATLYNKPDQLKLQKLQASVKRAKAQIDYEKQQIKLAEQQLHGGIEVTRGQLQTDLAAERAAKATMLDAKTSYQRSQQLFKAGDVSKQQKDKDYYLWQADQSDYERATQQVAVDRSALNNAHNGMSAMTLPSPDLLRAKLKVTQQSLAEAQAELKHQQLHLHDMVVRSPIDGVVDKTFVNPGEYVSPGQPLLMIHKPGAVWVVAKIKETSIRKIKAGQPVTISVDADPDLSFKGHVRVVGHAATSEFALLPNPNPSGNFTKITQRIPVRITIDKGPKKQLSPGMMVEVDIDVSGHKS